MTAGHQTTCAATVDHAVYCWGRNTSGQLGRGFASSHEAVPALVGGGIARKIIQKLKESTFIAAFTAKGRMKPLLQAMPVRVILNDKTALLGAARCATLAAADPAPTNA